MRLVASPAMARALFAPLVDAELEIAAFAYLDSDRRLLGMRHASSLCRDMLDLPIRDIAADSLVFDAAAVLVAHNHPSGDPTPSRADRDATHRLARALEALDVRLLDHLVVATRGVTSFATLGLL